MSEQMSDQEQVEMLKRWWKEYGIPVLTGVLIFLAASYAYNYWHSNKVSQQATASYMYSEFLGLSEASKTNEANALAASLQKDYKCTPYAGLAALFEAKQAVLERRLDVARQKLQWVMDNSSQRELRDLARERKERINRELKKRMG